MAHADEIRRRFASGNVTTSQIVMFGRSGGLIPCSAAIAVLVLCVQVNQICLGLALVLVFPHRTRDHTDRSGK
jgi:nickel/cobalt exporter